VGNCPTRRSAPSLASPRWRRKPGCWLVGRAGTAAHVERIVRGWRHVDRRTEAREAIAPAYDPRPARVSGRGRHGGPPGGQLEPEVGALFHAGAGCGPRESVISCARPRATFNAGAGDVFRGNVLRLPAAGRCTWPCWRGDSPPSRPRSPAPGGALPGGGACRRPGAGRSGAAGAVGPGRGHTRFRGNVLNCLACDASRGGS